MSLLPLGCPLDFPCPVESVSSLAAGLPACLQAMLFTAHASGISSHSKEFTPARALQSWLESRLQEPVSGKGIGDAMKCHVPACSVAQLYPTLCNPMDYSPPGSSVHRILQARILEGVAMASSRESSQPRDQTCIYYVSCIGRRALYH